MNSLQGKRRIGHWSDGFIGNRLVERLILEEGAGGSRPGPPISQCFARLARFPLRMVGGDVTDARTVLGAADVAMRLYIAPSRSPAPRLLIGR